MKKSLITLVLSLLIMTSCSSDNTNTSEALEKNQQSVSSDDIDFKSEIKESKLGKVTKYEITFYDYFDTVTSFTAYTDNRQEFEKYVDILNSQMKKYHQLFNSYNEFDGVNNVYTINKMAGKKEVKVDQKVIDLLKEGKQWYKDTNGDINIAAGSLLKIWTDFRDKANQNPKEAKLPEKSLLEEAAKHMDIDAIEINDDKNTVYIKDKDVQIDDGAIAKGYATELIKQELIKQGLKHGLLSVGGDVAIIGDNPTKENKKYSIGIQNPDLSKAQDYPSILDVSATSVVTSGDYQRYFEINGRKYHHIIDQETLDPTTEYKSVTVVAKNIAQADALSTALFLKDIDEGKALLKKFDAQAMWIDKNDKQTKTKGYEDLEIKN